MEVWIALALIALAVLWLSRRPPGRATFEAGARGSSGRSSHGLTRIHDVIPIPPPPGWPVLPPAPAGLDGSPPPEEYVAVADRSYARTTCPHCGVELNPLPKAKKRCRDCGQEIFVRSGPGGKRHLLAATELEGFQGLWAEHQVARSVEAAAAQEQAERIWRETLRRLGVQVGEYEMDVVGESYRHAALAGIRAALIGDSQEFEVRTIACLEREPGNPHDRNAVRVMVHGEMVGYLDRYSAEDYGPTLRRASGPFYVQAVLMGGRLTEDARFGPIGVRLEDVPEP